jgi:large subunit ribosomal protein L4
MQADVLNIEGQKTGRTVELPEDIFGIEPNEHVIYLAVKQYLAAQRQGTHKVKTRLEVHGSSKKLHRQKGTGGSRKGNLRNRKVKDLAKMSALASKAKGNAIVIVEDIKVEAPKTKQFTDTLKNLNVAGKKVLFVLPEYDDNLYLSMRNVPTVEGTLLADINTYDIVNAEVLLLSESAAKVFSDLDEEKA